MSKIANKKELVEQIKILAGRLAEKQRSLDLAYNRLEKAERNWEKVANPYYEMEDRLKLLERKLKKQTNKP